MKNNRTKINFINCKSEIPIVNLRLKDGGEFLAIIDSGSEQTMFDKVFADAHGLPRDAENAGYNIIGVATEYSINCAPVVAVLDVGKNKTTTIVGITADLTSLNEHFTNSYGEDYAFQAIIGSDSLYAIDAKINYIKKQISFTHESAQ